MGHEPSPAFITSVLELKLDLDTMFKWQKHSQSEVDIPHYNQILEFIDLHALASETSNQKKVVKPNELNKHHSIPEKMVTSLTSTFTK